MAEFPVRRKDGFAVFVIAEMPSDLITRRDDPDRLKNRKFKESGRTAAFVPYRSFGVKSTKNEASVESDLNSISF